MFLLHGNDEKSTAAKKAFEEAANKLKGKILLSWSEVSDGLGKRLGDFIGVKESDCPTVRIVVPGEGMKKFTMETEITTENLVGFFDKYSEGKLSATYKSDPIPEKNDKPVKVVVGKSFKDIVMDETKDVLLKIYAPWCGHCKSMAPIYEKVAEKLQKANPNIILADMDGTTNEAEGIEI